MIPSNLRELAIDSFNNNRNIDIDIVIKFKSFLESYCSELKATEWDILLNDKTYKVVLSLFENIMIKNPEFCRV